MRAPTPSSSGSKATTTPRRLQATAIVGAALIGFLVGKSPEARTRLETIADQARQELAPDEIDIIDQLLAAHPTFSTSTN